MAAGAQQYWQVPEGRHQRVQGVFGKHTADVWLLSKFMALLAYT
jgi:hypothetical protein